MLDESFCVTMYFKNVQEIKRFNPNKIIVSYLSARKAFPGIGFQTFSKGAYPRTILSFGWQL